MEYLSAWQELQFGVFRFSVALLVPEIQSVILHMIFFHFVFRFSRKIAENSSFFAKNEKTKKMEAIFVTFQSSISGPAEFGLDLYGTGSSYEY